MRILFNSKEKEHKSPFGCVTPGQECKLNIHIPVSVGTKKVECILQQEDGTFYKAKELPYLDRKGAYERYEGSFTLDKPGLYFYWFRIFKLNSSFCLFKAGDDTNMEAGELWQLSCIPEDFTTPDWAKGAVIYQVFPDRFCKKGDCDLTGKLQPYKVHQSWNEEVDWEPTEDGLVLNNDFYGGNFRGITDKLPYIASLGTTILYLNPISKSFSSHRYDTGDYKTPDPMLGTEEDFKTLCETAHELGIRVILDGVFSHTGSDSLYFDRQRHFGGKGAYCDPASPYRSWYTFQHWPNTYNSWWGFDTLPTVNKTDPAFIDYIITAEDSVIAHWLSLGADGFRLDVADELPDAFLKILKTRLRQLKPDALLMGEVWEDASNKEAYGIRRRYFTDGTLDSIMNYPFRTAILQFMRDRDDGKALKDRVMSIAENYPKQVLSCNMNLLGTHDTARILTALVDDFDGSRDLLAKRKLSRSQKDTALSRLEMATFLQYTLPGSPSIYYGDEAGMEGGKDPFNRRTFPWGAEDTLLQKHYMQLGQLRKSAPALGLGNISFFQSADGRLGFARSTESQKLKIYVNRSLDSWSVPAGKLLYGKKLRTAAPNWLELEPMGFCVVEE